MHALALLAAALAAGQAPASPSAAPAAPPAAAAARDLEAPPPQASAAEQALWRRASDTNDRIVTDRSAATRLQVRAQAAVARLEALGAEGKLPADRVKHLVHEVNHEWEENVELLLSPWPVDPTRACRYDALFFDSALQLPPGRRRTDEVAATKAGLEACLARADTVLRKLAVSSRELEEELVEAERVIAGSAPGAVAR